MTLAMSRGLAVVLLALVGTFLGQPVSARPEYLAQYQADPLRRPEVDGCATCHVAATGGGARNEFGSAYEATSQAITPLLRASFPQYFRFDTVTLADGTALSFSDPQSKVVVVQRGKERFAAELAALAPPRAAPLPPPQNRMTFFVTSRAPAAFEQFGGLAGADRHCQSLAKSVGADDRTWRAYLSTSFGDKAAVNAGDRIGGGPWYNAKGILVARGPADLHAAERLRPDLLLTEGGDPLDAGDAPAIVTGTLANGTAAIGKNCQNWTSGSGEASAADPSHMWNSGTTVSCTQEAATASPLRLYCFAAK